MATKRAHLIKLLEKNGWYLKRNGSGHDIYTNGKESETIPRHNELKENLAKAIDIPHIVHAVFDCDPLGA